MILEELLDDKYPHATFHDAKIENMKIDYMNNTALLHVELYVGDPNDDNEKEIKRRGILQFTDLFYCVIEPPDTKYPYGDVKGLWLTGDSPVAPGYNKGKVTLPQDTSDDTFIHSFYISDWNSTFYICAKDASFEWLE
jgi:hypothetical protein